jgi:hypothetical protein
MADILLNNNQAALILTISDDGEVEINVASPNTDEGESSLAAGICMVLGEKLSSDEKFQSMILSEIDEEVETENERNA